MSEGYVLAIDESTTGSTVLIFDYEGSISRWKQPVKHPKSGGRKD